MRVLFARPESAHGYPDLEKARECHAALREIFIHHPGGWADKDALQQQWRSSPGRR